VCTDNPSCDAQCWRTQFEFDQDYPSTTCAEEEYICCGDNWCDVEEEGCNACEDDCGSVPDCTPNECNTHADCDPGEICNTRHECIEGSHYVEPPTSPSCGGECTSNDDCCGLDVCLGAPGLKYCGIPSRTYCQNAPTCTTNAQCDFSTVCAPDPAAEAYCDPGINRCMFVQGGWGCVDWTNICII
jgi:hypothetical protein